MSPQILRNLPACCQDCEESDSAMVHNAARMPGFSRKLPVGILISVYLVLNLIGAWWDGPTMDEPSYIASGYYTWLQGSLLTNPFHPFLVKIAAGFPLYFGDVFSVPLKAEVWKTSSFQEFARRLFEQNAGMMHWIVFLARCPVILINTLLAGLFLRKIRLFFGERTAVLTASLLLFSPTFLAHSRYVTLDISCAFLCMLAAAYFYEFMEKGGLRLFGISFIAVLAVLQSKFAAWLVLPVLWMAFAFSQGSRIPRLLSSTFRMCLVIASVVAVIGSIYYFGVKDSPDWYMVNYQKRLVHEGPRAFHSVVSSLEKTPGFRGLSWYLTGLFCSFNLKEKVKSYPSVLGKMVYRGGAPGYFPLLFLTKETPFFLFLAGLVLLACMSGRIRILRSPPSPSRGLLVFSLLFAAAFWAFAVSANLNIGIRHVLPSYPAIFLLAAVGADRLLRLSGRSGAALILLVYLHVGTTLWNFPHVLPYFNIFSRMIVSGPFSTDSNFDWGQDTYRLYREAARLGLKEVYFDCLTSVDPTWFDPGIKFHRINFMEAASLPPGSYVAVSRGLVEREKRAGKAASTLPMEQEEKTADIGATLELFRIRDGGATGKRLLQRLPL